MAISLSLSLSLSRRERIRQEKIEGLEQAEKEVMFGWLAGRPYYSFILLLHACMHVYPVAYLCALSVLLFAIW